MGFVFSKMFNRKGAEDRAPESKLYRTISTVSILGLFTCVVLIVLSVMQIIKFSSTLIGIIGTIGCLCLGCVFMLPWIKRLERKELKVVSLVFISLNALVPVLWIISIWVIIGFAKSGNFSTGLANFLKAVLIISLQFMVASTIATGVTKYKKTMLVFQGITYASYLYIDFIITYIMCCFIFGGESIVRISDNISLLSNIWVWTIFIIAVIFMIISNGIMQRTDNRRMVEAADDFRYGKQKEDGQAQPSESTEEQLAKLKDLLDKNLITEEEYNKKRNEIIEKL